MDLLPECAFRRLQWSLVAITAVVIIGAFAWHGVAAPVQGVPVKLPLADYHEALRGARFVVVGDSSGVVLGKAKATCVAEAAGQKPARHFPGPSTIRLIS